MKALERDDLWTVDGRQLHLTIRHITNDSVEICLTNLSYDKYKKSLLNRMALLLIVYGWLVCWPVSVPVLVHIAFLIVIAVHLYILVGLVQCGKLG